MRRNGFGAHQLAEPSRRISDGTNSPRMIDASMSTAKARLESEALAFVGASLG